MVHLDWAAPLPSVVMASGESCPCGGCKLTVNKEAKQDRCPLPLTNEIFQSSANGEKFTKLDLYLAYRQLLLGEASENLTSINNNMGRHGGCLMGSLALWASSSVPLKMSLKNFQVLIPSLVRVFSLSLGGPISLAGTNAHIGWFENFSALQLTLKTT